MQTARMDSSLMSVAEKYMGLNFNLGLPLFHVTFVNRLSLLYKFVTPIHSRRSILRLASTRNSRKRDSQGHIVDNYVASTSTPSVSIPGVPPQLSKEPQMDDLSSGTDSDYSKYWIDWFLSTKGNEYFCEVDEEYIVDRFNLTGLNSDVQHYSQALELITDTLDDDLEEDVREQVEKAARHLYGLIHGRFVLTSRGLVKMLEKYKKADFGRCPRVFCHNQPLLPVGLSDLPYTKSVKLYCPRCEDIYNPKSTRHAAIDGAYFGSSFPHMLFQVYPHLLPPKTAERYTPRIFGFKIHEISQLHRWQDRQRESMLRKLEEPRQEWKDTASTLNGDVKEDKFQ